MGLLSEEQLRTFDEVGAVTLDALGDRDHPLLRALEAMLDEHAAEAPADEDGKRPARSMVPMETRLQTPAFVDYVSHEWLEGVACELLRSPRVLFFQSGSCGCSYPQARPEDGSYGTGSPGDPGHEERARRWRAERFSGHVDTWVSASDWHATPRRTILLFWLWLADVTVDRSPMMFCPASHLPIAAANEAHGAPHLPHAGGAPYRKDDGSIVSGYLPYNFDSSQLSEPQPLLAKRGQVTALTTSMYHTSSPNFGAQRPATTVSLSFAQR